MVEDTNNGAVAPAGDLDQQGAQFMVEKIYVKDVSFEVPNAPAIFNTEAENNLGMNLQHNVNRLSDNAFEVVLQVTLNCTQGDSTVYLAEVKQAGVFGLFGFDEQGTEYLLSTQAPAILFPYARQVVSDLIQAGGFPPFLLQPINFEALYADAMQQRMMEGSAAAEGAEGSDDSARHLDS